MLGNRTGASVKKNGTLESSSSYTYNALGWLMEEVTDGKTKTYTYDKAGNRLSFSVGGTTQYYTYDLAGQLQQVKKGKEALASYTYDNAGRVATQTLKNGNVTAYTYNYVGWITNQKTTNNQNVLSDIGYAYYTDGNIEKETGSSGTKQYTYDGLNRLSACTDGETAYAYSFDSRSNRTGLTVSGGENYTVSGTFDKNNKQLTSVKTTADEIKETTYSYDGRGNLTRETEKITYPEPESGAEEQTAEESMPAEEETEQPGSTEQSGIVMGLWQGEEGAPGDAWYTYDSLNRLTSAFKNGVQEEYTYTADGLRAGKKINNVYHAWTWDGSRLVSDGLDTYYYGKGLISSSSGNYYVQNAHGDVVALTNGAGEITKTYAYDPFGAEKNIDSADNNPFRYCSEYYDKGIDKIYLRARTYDPTMGRFTQQDPACDGFNWYVYCSNNPVMFVDPTGLIPSLEDAAEMASRSYNTYDMTRSGLESRKLGDGWRLIDEWKGSEGLVIHIYVRGDGEHSSYTGPKEYAFVNKGSSTWEIG